MAGLPVTARPPFSPSDLPAILGEHDVLVLPSVMRETYSLLTREALSAGLPVVCTDTLGPEEVVTHLENGLVVPAADPVALSVAMKTILDDRDLLTRLQAGAARPLRVRSLADQVDGLERLLRGTNRPVASTRARSTGVRHVVFACGIEGAPLRYRAAVAGGGARSRRGHLPGLPLSRSRAVGGQHVGRCRRDVPSPGHPAIAGSGQHRARRRNTGRVRRGRPHLRS